MNVRRIGRRAGPLLAMLATGVGSARAQQADVAARVAPSPAPADSISITVREGTALGFDLSRAGRTIVFDLLGQLWTLDPAGGEARAITDAVRDTAEVLDPSISPDGLQVVFSGERGGRRGLWIMDIGGGEPRLLSRTPDGEGFDGQGAWSPDGRAIAFTRAVVQVTEEEVLGWSEIALLDLASGEVRSLPIEGLPEPDVRDPAWSPDGARIAFVAAWAQDGDGGRLWSVPAEGGLATPLTPEGMGALAPAFSPDGERIAFLAADSTGRVQVWVMGPAPRRLTDHADVAPTRVRWTHDGASILYAADGGLWRIPATGGAPVAVPFAATLTIPRTRVELPSIRFPAPGESRPVRGHRGLALSPSGRQVGVIALGRIWVVPIAGDPPAFGEARAIAEVPHTAHGLAWSPDETELAWAGGRLESEDLYATAPVTGETRRITELEGGEREPLWSPDGTHIAFVHLTPEEFRLRVVAARAETVRSLDEARDLGEVSATWVGETADAPAWSPDSRWLLLRLEPDPVRGTGAELVSITGERRRLARFSDAPVFLQWPALGTIRFIRHDQLWTATFDTVQGIIGDPTPLSNAAAFYPSTASDGSLLYLSDEGYRLRAPSGEEWTLGWPLHYTVPRPPSLVLHNVRIVDGTGAPLSDPRDVLVENGRIARIASAGQIKAEGGTRVLDAGGRTAIPGLMDLHMHSYDTALLPAILYYGVTTIRDQGSRIVTTVAAADAAAAGAVPGPRVSYGGFQFFTDWPFDSEEWRGIEPAADPGHVERSVALARALGADHVKTRTFRRWDLNARIVDAAHRRGMRATGHCAHQLPLVVAGIGTQEHVGACTGRGDPIEYDDILELFRAADISVVPTVLYWDLPGRIARAGGILPDHGLDSWEPVTGIDWMLNLPADDRSWWERRATASREMVARLHRAGIRIGVGTDVWQVPWAVHLELEELVRAGLTPIEAIHAATGAAAEILGAENELGTIEEGKWADIVVLDADPLADIRNTGRIHAVIKGGEIVDRAALRDLAREP